MSFPKISIIMAAYNRAETLPRAIESVFRSEYSNWELIIVDDCSSDNTREIIEQYRRKDSRIRAAFHDKNRHVHAAKNTGFDMMKGDWFTTLDSDDEMVPDAFDTMLAVPVLIDSSIDAVTCNCIDSTTHEFSGKGLDRDQWLDFEAIATRCSGEYWGITRQSLLDGQRFNGRMRGGAENILWWKINQKARRYYLHKGLRIYHTEGDDRLCQMQRGPNVQERCDFYCEMALETEYLGQLKSYRPKEYITVQRNIALAQAMSGRHSEALDAYWKVAPCLPVMQRLMLRMAVMGGQSFARALANMAVKVR